MKKEISNLKRKIKKEKFLTQDLAKNEDSKKRKVGEQMEIKDKSVGEEDGAEGEDGEKESSG